MEANYAESQTGHLIAMLFFAQILKLQTVWEADGPTCSKEHGFIWASFFLSTWVPWVRLNRRPLFLIVF